MPYEPAAAIVSDLDEPAEAIKDELPDKYRVIENIRTGESEIEYYNSDDDIDGWESFAKITADAWAMDCADALADGLGEQFRVVFDYNNGTSGAWMIEKRTGGGA
jgi:hypothetical protein